MSKKVNRKERLIKTDPKFAALTGWGFKDIDALGHELSNVTVEGRWQSGKNGRYQRSVKLTKNFELFVKEIRGETTGHVKIKGNGYKKIVRKFITHKDLLDLNFVIVKFVTVNKETKDVCTWQRYSDASGKMMALRTINGIDSNKYTEAEMVSAADSMCFDFCDRQPGERAIVCGVKV